MTTWLIENGTDAHAFSDADDAATAACGYQLQGVCDQCGTDMNCRVPPRGHTRCLACEVALEKKP